MGPFTVIGPVSHRPRTRRPTTCGTLRLLQLLYLGRGRLTSICIDGEANEGRTKMDSAAGVFDLTSRSTKREEIASAAEAATAIASARIETGALVVLGEAGKPVQLASSDGTVRRNAQVSIWLG